MSFRPSVFLCAFLHLCCTALIMCVLPFVRFFDPPPLHSITPAMCPCVYPRPQLAALRPVALTFHASPPPHPKQCERCRCCTPRYCTLFPSFILFPSPDPILCSRAHWFLQLSLFSQLILFFFRSHFREDTCVYQTSPPLTFPLFRHTPYDFSSLPHTFTQSP